MRGRNDHNDQQKKFLENVEYSPSLLFTFSLYPTKDYRLFGSIFRPEQPCLNAQTLFEFVTQSLLSHVGEEKNIL